MRKIIFWYTLLTKGLIRVLDLGSKGHQFKTHWNQCVVSLSKTLYPMLSTGSAQEHPSDICEKLLTGMYM